VHLITRGKVLRPPLCEFAICSICRVCSHDSVGTLHPACDALHLLPVYTFQRWGLHCHICRTSNNKFSESTSHFNLRWPISSIPHEDACSEIPFQPWEPPTEKHRS